MPPLGGITTILGFSVIAYAVLLKEKIRVPPPFKLGVKTPTAVSCILQKFYSSIPDDNLGQKYTKFKNLLGELQLNGSVSITDTGITVPAEEIRASQLVKIADKVLEYLEQGKVEPQIVDGLIDFLESVYPRIEIELAGLIKNHENYVRRSGLLARMLGGDLRKLYLPEGFTEEDLERFSKSIGSTYSESSRNLFLLEFDPSQRYESATQEFITETLSNNKTCNIFTRRNSNIIKNIPKSEAVQVFYLSPHVDHATTVSVSETLLPINDTTHLLDVIYRLAKQTTPISIVFDNISDLTLSIGFDSAYQFLRRATDLIATSKNSALFLLNATAHEERVRSSFEGLFNTILTFKDNKIQVLKK